MKTAELISVGVYGGTFHLNMKNILQTPRAELLNLWTFVCLKLQVGEDSKEEIPTLMEGETRENIQCSTISNFYDYQISCA